MARAKAYAGEVSELKMAHAVGGPIELREKRDGTWTVWYLDEAFIPCPGVCRLKEVDRRHKCEHDRPYVQSYFGVRGISCPEPDVSYEAAMEFAVYMQAGNETREIKVVRAS